MVNKELVSLIEIEKEAGKSPPEVEEILLLKGYNKEEVDEAINYVANINLEEESQSSKNQAREKKAPPTPPSPNSLDNGIIKKRNPYLVVVFTILSFGIYAIVWFVKTSKELHSNTSKALKPKHLLFFLIPVYGFFYSFYFLWKYCEAMNELTGVDNKIVYLLYIFTIIGGIVMTQIHLNKKAE